MPAPEIKRMIKQVVHRLSPRLFWYVASYRAERQREQTDAALGLRRIKNLVVKNVGQVIVGGPFKGMTYTNVSVRSAAVPKVMGSYESELHPAIRRLQSSNVSVVLDVGCGEGYYSVGFALTMPRVEAVYAFDPDPRARALCRELARINGVMERVRIERQCTHDRLNGLLTGSALLIIDCEGCEVALLDPDRVPNLRTTAMIVECHDFNVAGATETIHMRFRDSHAVEMIEAADRDPRDYPAIHFLNAEEQRLALSELRIPGQRWLVLEPRRR